jgi:Spy/CpxP family protein refolding chaperone
VRSLLALVAASALLPSGVAVAQDREEIEAKAEERLEQVIENLELTDEQVEALRPIFQSSIERQAAVLEQYGIDLSDGEQGGKLSRRERRKLRGDLKDEREKTDDAIAEVLTDEQFDAYKEMAEERQDEMRARRKDRRDN